MGKTDKQKKDEKKKGDKKNAAKDKVQKSKVAKQGGSAKKKKWTAGKAKDKLNNAVFWTKSLHDKLVKDIIGKEAYITPSMISDKLKVNVSCAREAIHELLATEQIKPNDEYHSKFCCFVKGPKYEAQEKKKEPKPEGGKKEKPEKGEKKEKKEKKKGK